MGRGWGIDWNSYPNYLTDRLRFDVEPGDSFRSVMCTPCTLFEIGHWLRPTCRPGM